MAALQTLRNKPALLMSVIGGALLLFIVTMVLENQSSIFGPDTKVGEIYGEEISIQDFESKVSDEINFQEVSSILLQNRELTEQQRESIRLSVWEMMKTQRMVAAEAEKLGLLVTKEELQKALTDANFDEARLCLTAGQVFTGNPSIDGYKQFLNDFDKHLAQIRQQGGQNEELLFKLRQACLYAEKRLEMSVLINKYSSLVQLSVTSNPVVAKMNFDERNSEVKAEIATLSYNSIEDKDVTVNDDDLKKQYEAQKERFYASSETRAIKMIRVPVLPSAEDRMNLMREVRGWEDSLRAATTVEDVAAVIGESKTSVRFENVYYKKEQYTQNRLYDIASALDTLSVGYVKATATDGQFITTYKLVDKVVTPDSVLVKMMLATDKAQADSIVNAVNNGSVFGDIAKALSQPDTAVWQVFEGYAGKSVTADSTLTVNLCDIPVNNVGILPYNGTNFLVAQVLDAKHPTAKYNVAVVKCPIEYSSKTYDSAKSKLDNYLANNKTAQEFVDNAAKEGYQIQSENAFSTERYMEIRQLGGDNARAAVQWIFDEAKAGDVSNVFECGDANVGTTLLAVAVTSVCEDQYLPWDNEGVKEQLTGRVRMQLKADKVMADFGAVKTMEAAKQVKGVSADTLDVTLVRDPYNDPCLTGALEKMQQGQFAVVKGGNSAYAVQVLEKKAGANSFREAYEVLQTAGTQMQMVFSVFNELLDRDAEVKDNRYKF